MKVEDKYMSELGGHVLAYTHSLIVREPLSKETHLFKEKVFDMSTLVLEGERTARWCSSRLIE
jgi:hypothetical protein